MSLKGTGDNASFVCLIGPTCLTAVVTLTPLDPSSKKGCALRVSGFALQMPTIVMKPKALPVAILSQRLSVWDSYKKEEKKV